MAKFYDDIPPFMIEWILKQHMFWVASAPLSGTGHVNVSPKSTANCFHVVNNHQVWYEDLSGSGVETIAHLRENGNGRITILFQAFEGPARIVRLFGYGKVHEYGTPEFDAFIPRDMRKPGCRAVIVVDVYQSMTSCGYAVPFYKFVGHRHELIRTFDKKEMFDRRAVEEGSAELKANGLKAYWAEKNATSLDGLPGLQTALDSDELPISTFDRDIKKDTSNMMTKTVASMRAEVFAKLDPHVTLLGGFVLGVVATTFLSQRLTSTLGPFIGFAHFQ